MHRFSVTLSFAPKHLSDRTLFNEEHTFLCASLNKVLSDKPLGTKLSVAENWWVLFNSLTVFFTQIFTITVTFQKTLTKTAKPQVLETSGDWGNDSGGD